MCTCVLEKSAAASCPLCINDAYREFLEKLAAIVGANMAELGRQRAVSAAAGAGMAAVYDLERKLADLEASTVLEPYTGEDLKEGLKAAGVCIIFCRWTKLLLVTIPCALNKLIPRFLQAGLQSVMQQSCPAHVAFSQCCVVKWQVSTEQSRFIPISHHVQ